MPILSLQPGSAEGIDTKIAENFPNNNYGISTSLTVSGPTAQHEKMLIRFSGISGIPAGSTIISATLRLHSGNNWNANAMTIGVHRSLVDWFEGTSAAAIPPGGVNASTWNHRNHNGSVAWAGGAGGAAGSDYVATPTDSTVVTTSNTFYTWDVTADVQAFVSGTATNRGWWLVRVSGDQEQKFFTSSDASNAANRPELIIEYEEIGLIAGSADGSSIVSGEIFGIGFLRGQSTGVAATGGNLVSNAIRGSAAGAATVSGHLRSDNISGAAHGIAAVTGILSSYTIEGDAAGVASVAGRLMGIVEAAGASAGIATVNGEVFGIGYLIGQAMGSASVFGSAIAAGLLRGSTHGLANVAGRMIRYARNVVPPLPKYPDPLLFLSDGIDRFNLLNCQSGYCVCAWDPVIAQYKGGGQWADSPMATGRRLTLRRFANAVEVMELEARGSNQDQLIGFTSELLRWLEAAADYWTAEWGARAVYLGAKAAYERNIRYAVIHAASAPELRNPYAQPFFTHPTRGVPTLERITLRIERGQWLNTPPGEGEPVAISSFRSWIVTGVEEVDE